MRYKSITAVQAKVYIVLKAFSLALLTASKNNPFDF